MTREKFFGTIHAGDRVRDRFTGVAGTVAEVKTVPVGFYHSKTPQADPDIQNVLMAERIKVKPDGHPLDVIYTGAASLELLKPKP